jgi:hypothetical protein
MNLINYFIYLVLFWKGREEREDPGKVGKRK